MKINKFIILFAILAHHSYNVAQPEVNDLTQILELPNSKKIDDMLTPFDYTNENLINIINRLTAQQGINILFPTDLTKIDIDVTLNLKHKIKLSEAWAIVNTFLEIAGFSLVPKGITYEIVTNKDVNREPLAT